MLDSAGFSLFLAERTRGAGGLHAESLGQARTVLSMRTRRRNPSAQYPHRRTATRAQKRRTRLHPCRVRAGNHLQHHLQQRDQTFTVGVQKAEVARPPEALGQNVLQDQAQEGRPAYRAHRTLAGLAVAIAKADLSVLAGKNVLLPNHAPIQIAAQIDQGFFSIAHAFAIDHPLRRNAGWKPQSRLAEGRQHLGPEHLGQGAMVEQIAVAATALRSPAPRLRIQRRRRHRQMDMRMEIQAAGMGVQHRHRAGVALQVFIVPAKGVHRGPGTIEQHGVERALMSPGQFPDFRRQRESEQEVVCRHLPPQLAFQPLLAFVMLAVRAIAMAAGVRHQAFLVAGAARRHHARHHGGATVLHGGEGLGVAGQDRGRILLEVVRFKAGDDGGEGNHLTVPHWIEKRLIKALMRALA